MQNKAIGLDGSDIQTCVASLAGGIEINHQDVPLDGRMTEIRTWAMEVRRISHAPAVAWGGFLSELHGRQDA